jgi:hypothetical protein
MAGQVEHRTQVALASSVIEVFFSISALFPNLGTVWWRAGCSLRSNANTQNKTNCPLLGT